MFTVTAFLLSTYTKYHNFYIMSSYFLPNYVLFLYIVSLYIISIPLNNPFYTFFIFIYLYYIYYIYIYSFRHPRPTTYIISKFRGFVKPLGKFFSKKPLYLYSFRHPTHPPSLYQNFRALSSPKKFLTKSGWTPIEVRLGGFSIKEQTKNFFIFFIFLFM